MTIERENGECVARAEQKFTLAGLGQETYRLRLRVPDARGKFVVKASADAGGGSPTLSRRRIEIR